MYIGTVKFFFLNAARKRDGVLEPDERKRSRPVLRGERGRKSTDLLGYKKLGGNGMVEELIDDLKKLQLEM